MENISAQLQSQVAKNIPAQSMTIVEQGSYGKYICSIHAHRRSRQLWKIYLFNPCPSQNKVVMENISAQLQSQVAKNIPAPPMSRQLWKIYLLNPGLIIEQGSYGKLICSITILGCQKIYLFNPCPSQIKVVVENISVHPMTIVEQGSCGKYICSITIQCCHENHICPITIQCCHENISAQLRFNVVMKIYLPNYDPR